PAAFDRSEARLSAVVDGDRLAGWRVHLHAVLHALVVVGHVPVLRRLRGDVLAAAHFLSRLRVADAVDVGAERAAADRAADRRHGVAGAAADLVADDAAEHAADDRARHVQIAPFAGLAALDPAALLGRAHDGARRGDRHLAQALLGPA